MALYPKMIIRTYSNCEQKLILVSLRGAIIHLSTLLAVLPVISGYLSRSNYFKSFSFKIFMLLENKRGLTESSPS